MTSQSGSPSTEVCTRVKSLGYAASKRIRIYSERAQLCPRRFLMVGH